MIAEQLAGDWLEPPPASFWSWTDEGEVAIWRSGGVIAFREELIALLPALANEGLPPLTPLLLTLAAARGVWRDHKRELDDFLRANWGPGETTWESALASGLDRLAALPSGARQGVEARQALLDSVFEAAMPAARPWASEVVTGLELGVRGPGPGYFTLLGRDVPREMDAAFEALATGLAELDAAALAKRAGTGLDETPAALEDELPMPRRLAARLAGLDADSELAGVARLARQVSAAMSLPRRVDEPDDVALGGISDISRHGSLDRLLPSELANDDLVLALRITTNEALYWRREVPPGTPAPRREILLDLGVRLWGTARLFAVAVGLGLALRCREDQEASLWTRLAGTALELDPSRPEGLEQLCGALGTEAHAAALVETRLAETRSDSAADPRELVLVTSARGAEDPEFRERVEAALADSPEPLFVATVEASGELRLWRWSSTGRGLVGRKRLHAAKLSLSALVAEPKQVRPAASDDSDLDPLPPLFGAKWLPFRVPWGRIRDERTIEARDGRLFHVRRDGRLLASDRRGSPFAGPRPGSQIVNDLPRGEVFGMHFAAGEPDQGELRLLVAAHGELHSVRVAVDRGEARIASKPFRRGIEDVVALDGVYALICGRRMIEVVIVDPVSLRILDARRLPGAIRPIRARRGSRFFRHTDGHVEALGWNGRRSELEPVPLTGPRDIPFDHADGSGPWLIRRDAGLLRDLTEAAPRTLPEAVERPVKLVGIRSDGDRLLMASGHGLWAQVVAYRVADDRWSTIDAVDLPAAVAGDWMGRAHGGELMRKLQSIGRARSADGQVVPMLETRSGARFAVRLDETEGEARMSFEVHPELDFEARLVLDRSARPVAGLPGKEGLVRHAVDRPSGVRVVAEDCGFLHLSDRQAGREMVLLPDPEGPGLWIQRAGLCCPEVWRETNRPARVPTIGARQALWALREIVGKLSRRAR